MLLVANCIKFKQNIEGRLWRSFRLQIYVASLWNAGHSEATRVENGGEISQFFTLSPNREVIDEMTAILNSWAYDPTSDILLTGPGSLHAW